MSELATLQCNIQAREKSHLESDVKTDKYGTGNCQRRLWEWRRRSALYGIQTDYWKLHLNYKATLMRRYERDQEPFARVWRRSEERTRGLGDGWEGISQGRVSEDDKCEACWIRCHGYLCVYGEDCITLPDWCGTWREKVDPPVHDNGSQIRLLFLWF